MIIGGIAAYVALGVCLLVFAKVKPEPLNAVWIICGWPLVVLGVAGQIFRKVR